MPLRRKPRAWPVLALAGLLAMPLLALPLPALAHRAWMLPSATVLSGEAPWVTIDAAISNDLFYFEHFPLQLDDLTITAPDGSRAEPQNLGRGRFRSTFDLQLSQPGTYRVSVAGGGIFARWTENGEQKRFRGSREAFEREVPRDAQGLRASLGQRRVEVFVTRGSPSDGALRALNEGLELVPITHPNDLVAGEPARFRMLLDGAPAAGVEVTIIPGGNRYRDTLNERKVSTDAEGIFTATWQGPGMYWLSASLRDDKSGIPDIARNASYAATLEVLP